MKKTNFALNGFLALAALAAFTQCDGNKTAQPQANNAAPAAGVANIKIAYVDVDSLLSKYQFCKDLNESMMRKQENVNATLNEKGQALNKEVQEFERKLNNHVFTQERAQEEQNRLMRKRDELQQLHNRLMGELQQESDKTNMQLRDSVNTFLKEYNKTKGYSLIISNTGSDNLLYADQALNITQEVVDGLNKRYRPAKSE